MKSSLVRIFSTLGVACFCLVVVSCGPGDQTATEWQSTVDSLSSLQALNIPEHLLQENASKTGEEFDVNAYFSVLDHLSIEPGYALDYVYWYDFMGGFPVLYARPADQSPYLTLSEYRSAVGEIPGEEFSHGYMSHVQIDDTAEGFFQFVVLRIMGRQFYLHWHANYNDAMVICDQERLEQILETLSGDSDYSLPEEAKEQARALDVAPVVEFKDDTVLVKVVTFTKWGGFFRDSYTISRSFPHKILEAEEEELVPYDCGIQF